MNIEILVFEVDRQRFGVRSGDVVEVLRAATLSPLPRAPKVIEGVLNLRGRVVPVLDTREMLGLPARQMQHTDHLVVVQADGQVLTLRVDRATGLLRLESDRSESPEAGARAQLIELVARTSAGLVYVLDSRCLLSQDESSSLATALAGRGATEVAS